MTFVFSRGFAPFTTTDIADRLNVKEYAVRAAVSWLRLGGFLDFYCWHDERKHVKCYRWTGKSTPVESIRRSRDDREYVEACRCSDKSAVAVQDLLTMMCLRRTIEYGHEPDCENAATAETGYGRRD